MHLAQVGPAGVTAHARAVLHERTRVGVADYAEPVTRVIDSRGVLLKRWVSSRLTATTLPVPAMPEASRDDQAR